MQVESGLSFNERAYSYRTLNRQKLSRWSWLSELYGMYRYRYLAYLRTTQYYYLYI